MTDMPVGVVSPVGELIHRFSVNSPDLDRFWYGDETRKLDAIAAHDAVSASDRRKTFGLGDVLELSVCKGVFAFAALGCKPYEFVSLSHPGFEMAIQKGFSFCQIINAHLSQRFKGRYILHHIVGMHRNKFLSGWFRRSGGQKTHFCVGPGHIIVLGQCVARGLDCIDRNLHRMQIARNGFWWLSSHLPCCQGQNLPGREEQLTLQTWPRKHLDYQSPAGQSVDSVSNQGSTPGEYQIQPCLFIFF